MIIVFLIMMIVFAIMSIQTPILRHAIIYAGIFSFLCSFCYLLYQAPDVAIAEAVIGCTLSTVLYLVALKKYKIFRVYYHMGQIYEKNEKKDEIIQALNRFCYDTELELDLIYSHKAIQFVLTQNSYDLIIEETPHNFIIHGGSSNYHYDQLVRFFASKLSFNAIYEPSNEERDVIL